MGSQFQNIPGWEDNENRLRIFQEGISLDAQQIQRAIDLVSEFEIAVQQDMASRQIKQAEKDLLTNLKIVTRDPAILEHLVTNLGKKLEEAAVESGLIKTSRSELPVRIREMADKFDQAGIKAVEFRRDRSSMYWPDGIRKSWTPETDNWTYKEWTKQELPEGTKQQVDGSDRI